MFTKCNVVKSDYSIEEIISIIKENFVPNKIGIASRGNYQAAIVDVKLFFENVYHTYIEKSKLARILQVMGLRRTTFRKFIRPDSNEPYGLSMSNEVNDLSFSELDERLIELGYTPEGTEEDMKKDGYCL